MAGTHRTHDFDLHGFVGLRLVNASESDRRAVRRQLGPIEAPLAREPDIVIRFVERLRPPGPLSLLGVDEVAFTPEAFLVLRARHKTAARVQIPFADIGSRCEIHCETGLAAVPLLVPIINLTALARGFVPLHASAFTYGGTGVVATGWSKGGKTETLLAFLARGAEYIGDEWVYVSRNGQRVYGIPEPIRLWDWHLGQLPQTRARIGRHARMRLKSLNTLRAISARLAAIGPRHRARIGLLNRVAALLGRQMYVDVPPERLLGGGPGPLGGPFDRLLFVSSSAAPEVRVEPLDSADVARRMEFSLEYERSAFMNFYRMFRFAFPDRANALIDQAAQLGRELLAAALAGKPAHAVQHPYPVRLADLFDAIEPLLRPPAPEPHPPDAPEVRRVLEPSQA
jgi:hypothetical protein